MLILGTACTAQIFLQYGGVSAWVPAQFAAPSLLPKAEDFTKYFKRRKNEDKSDKAVFRQVGACG